MSNSKLVDVTVYSPNHSGLRTHTIDRITPHCVVGQLDAETIGYCFTSSDVQASCNYGIGKDGRVVLVVDESKRSWCTSSRENDQRAVTIECASDLYDPYRMNDAVYNKLIKLCTDICKRYDKNTLLWFGDKDKALSYEPLSNEMVLTVHRWYANKPCPGDWLYYRLGDVAKKVTKNLKGENTKEDDYIEPSNNRILPLEGLVSIIYKGNVNIRTSPCFDNNIERTESAGTFTVVGISADKQWYKLKSGLYITTSTSIVRFEEKYNKLYKVSVNITNLSIYEEPNTNSKVVGTTGKGVFTIIDTKNDMGLLKSFAENKNGWIPLKYTKKL